MDNINKNINKNIPIYDNLKFLILRKIAHLIVFFYFFYVRGFRLI